MRSQKAFINRPDRKGLIERLFTTQIRVISEPRPAFITVAEMRDLLDTALAQLNRIEGNAQSDVPDVPRLELGHHMARLPGYLD
jgi:hypothetical protein